MTAAAQPVPARYANAVFANRLRTRYDTPETALNRILTEAPYYPRVSANKTAALSRPADYAIRWPYMQVNRSDMVSWLIFDCDHGDIHRWLDEDLPEPNLIVCTMGHHEVLSFHLFYAIEPVCTSATARAHPVAYMKAVYAALATRLGADPDYHGGPVCKTPGHQWWRTFELTSKVYSLGELKEHLDLDSGTPRFGKRADTSGLTHSRKLTLFEELRYFAYSIVNGERDQGSQDSFLARVTRKAHELNQFARKGFVTPSGERKGNLPVSDLTHVCKSICHWTWAHYTGRGGDGVRRGVMQLDPSMPLRERQRLASRRTATERVNKTEQRIHLACVLLRQLTRKITVTTISAATRLSRQTVAKYAQILESASAHTPQASPAPPTVSYVKFGVHKVIGRSVKIPQKCSFGTFPLGLDDGETSG